MPFNRVRFLPVVPSVSRAQFASPTRTNPGAGSRLSLGFIHPSAGRAQISRRRATAPLNEALRLRRPLSFA